MTEIEKYILIGLESGIHPKLYHPESDRLVNVSHVIVMPERFHLYMFDGQSGHAYKLDINKYEIPLSAYDEFPKYDETCTDFNYYKTYEINTWLRKHKDKLKEIF